jgi:serine/threonine-protein kinase RIO1
MGTAESSSQVVDAHDQVYSVMKVKRTLAIFLSRMRLSRRDLNHIKGGKVSHAQASSKANCRQELMNLRRNAREGMRVCQPHGKKYFVQNIG